MSESQGLLAAGIYSVRELWREKSVRCKVMDFLLIIPPLSRFNYSLPKHHVGPQAWPHGKVFASNQTGFDLLTFHLFSNHGMTFQVCQVRVIPAPCAAPPTLKGVERCTTLITETM